MLYIIIKNILKIFLKKYQKTVDKFQIIVYYLIVQFKEIPFGV